MIIKRGDILLASLDPAIGSEQNGVRPVLVIQNDVGNKYSPTIIVLAITSRIKQALPTHIFINSEESGLKKDSVVLVEQIRTLDKTRIIKKVGHLNNEKMEKVKEAVKNNLKLRINLYLD